VERCRITIIDADDHEHEVEAVTGAGAGDDPVVLVDATTLAATSGWVLKPEGLCHGEVCAPTRQWPELLVADPDDAHAPPLIDLRTFARLTGIPAVIDATGGVVAFGTPAATRAERLGSLDAPDFAVADLDGNPVTLADFAGRKKLLVAFASWCGCRYDLPDWQALADELADDGLSVIAVAVDERADDVREWVAQVRFPVLLDRDHVIADRYDIRNVPTVIWIDEDDRIVRPNDVAFGSDQFKDFHGIDSTPHHDALRRWVAGGELPLEDEDDVRAHQVLPTDDEQLARVHWRAAMFLHRAGQADRANAHFDQAGELAPFDLTIRRSSLPLRGIDPFLSPEFIEMYEGYLAAGRPGNGFEHEALELPH
jgi:peroxiredoxin